MMTRRDFEAMASNYADSFARMGTVDSIATGILWDNLLGFTGIAKESNPNFNRELFMATIADRLREIHNRRGLPEFNGMHFIRFGKYPGRYSHKALNTY